MLRHDIARGTSAALRALAVSLALLLGLLLALAASAPAAGQGGPGFSPSSGHAQVIAQGVSALPQGNVVWRTTRTVAPGPDQASFVAQSLGFVLANSGPLLL